MTSHDAQESTPSWWKRTIIRPTTQFEHDAVSHVQRVLRCPNVDGEMDDETVTHVRGLQMLFGLPVTGAIDEATARQVDRLRHPHAV
jgi:hypothetical protein